MSVVELLVRGVRSLQDLVLPLDGMTVLIGDNGTGKSSLLESLAILSQVPEHDFLSKLQQRHFGPLGLLSGGRRTMELGVGVRDDPGILWYRIVLRDEGGQFKIADETVYRTSAKAGHDSEPPKLLFRRASAAGPSMVASGRSLNADETILAYQGGQGPYAVIADAMRGIDIHLPFDVRPGWASAVPGPSMRMPRMTGPARRLERFGGNLVDAYQQLRAHRRDHWEETRDLIQLGLGPDVVDIQVEPVSPGHAGLVLEHRLLGRLPAVRLADGQLAYLALVAMLRLDEGRSLLAFDEPETGLHPQLLSRVVGLFERTAANNEFPLLLSTHSDALLDSLSQPVHATRVCELDDQGATQLKRLDPAQLEAWLGEFRGIGALRARGELDHALRSTSSASGFATIERYDAGTAAE